MDAPHEVIALERAGWAALTAGGEEAARFFGDVLAGEVLMLLPGGLVITDRAAALETMSGAPWDDHRLDGMRVLALGDHSCAVTYRGSAHRDGQEYLALFNSTYAHLGGRWRLALHQQTPVARPGA